MAGQETSCGTVLVVDDDVVIRELLSAVLGMEGFAVLLAESVTLTVKLTADAAAVGIPDRTPVAGAMFSHEGSPVADQV